MSYIVNHPLVPGLGKVQDPPLQLIALRESVVAGFMPATVGFEARSSIDMKEKVINNTHNG